jgi:hypothetical protein
MLSMKIYLDCQQCLFAAEDEDPEADAATRLARMNARRRHFQAHDIAEDSVYEVCCDKGHRAYATLQNPRFEILFDSSMLAFRDAYYRESVATCAAALEEFYAFYVRVVMRSREVDPAVIDRFGKGTRREERRLGAMHLAHALECGLAFETDEKRRNFRSDVIHNGRWPSVDEARSYAAYVFDTISDLAHPLRARQSGAFIAEMGAHLPKAHAEASKRAKERPADRSTTMSVATLLNITFAAPGSTRRTFDEAFDTWLRGNMWEPPPSDVTIFR